MVEHRGNARRRVAAIAVMVGAAALLAACGGSDDDATTAAAPAATTAPATTAVESTAVESTAVESTAVESTAGPATVALGDTGLGSVLVDGKGMTLYLYTPDEGSTSTCYDGCAKAWPPLLTEGDATAGDGVEASLLGTTARTDGTTQVTYNGHPLYGWVKDTAVGDTTGQGVKDVWWVMAGSGDAIGAPVGTETAATTSGEATAEAAAAPTVSLAETSLGSVLVDGAGMTLYLFTPDEGTESTCYEDCAKAWPPLLAGDAAPTAGDGLDATLLGTTPRTDGNVQVTYGGHPLYLWFKDAKPGDTTGQDVNDVWYVLGADGKGIGV
jgi:predicted lipoprotein with Yx(FWY)xxD motif